MPGLNLYTSNRLEVVAGKLAEVLSSPLASPLQKGIILVQSKGLERWVSMELARHHGICANIQFPFPNHFVYRIFRALGPTQKNPQKNCLHDWRNRMTTTFAFLTSYDPPGASESTLDPLGIYQIADQLAVQLVPAVRERRQRIRFLTAMAVGLLVTQGLLKNPLKSNFVSNRTMVNWCNFSQILSKLL